MNHESRCDISWWLCFLPSWNSHAIIPDLNWMRSPDMELFTDASGSLGYGIFYTGHWIANPWPTVLRNRSIQWKNFTPLLWYVFFGVISGPERSSSFVAIIKR